MHADHGGGEWPPFGSPHGGRSSSNEGPVTPTNGWSANARHPGGDGNGHRPPAADTLSAAPSLLGSRYELVRPIGGGAITRVLEARDRLAHRPVALKFPVERLAGDQAFLERLERAVWTAAGLAHPNVAAVHAMERDRGGAFVVVELVNGSSLLEMLEARGPMPPAVAARVAADVCAALAAGHARGVAHGHLTPANILLTIDGRVKVTDFALAQAGSPSEPAADLRALGRCLGAMLTGREPLEARAHPSADVPAGLAAIIARLAGDLGTGEDAEGYRSAADAGSDLARFAAAIRPGTAAPHRRKAAPAPSPAAGALPAAAAAAGTPTVAAEPDRPGTIGAAPGAPGSPPVAAGSSPGAIGAAPGAMGSPPGRSRRRQLALPAGAGGIGAAPGRGRRRRPALLAAAAAAAATVGVVAALGPGRQPGTPAAGQAPPPPPTAALATVGEPATTLAAPTTLAPTTASPATAPSTATDGQTTTSRRPAAERRVPNVVGMRRGQAADALARAGLGVRVRLVPAEEPGQVQRVIAQQPAAEQLAPAGSEVTILVGTKRPRG